jgi:hypothetical protein
MSELWRECLSRAIIEFEKRFLGNDSNVRLPLDSPLRVIELNERQLVATLLDLRTAKCKHLSQNQQKDAQAALKS